MRYEHWGKVAGDPDSTEIFIEEDAPQHAWLTSDRRLLWAVEATSREDALTSYYEHIGGKPEEANPDGRYEYGKLTPLQRHLAESADKHAITYRPWKLGDLRLSDEALVQHVQAELAEQGFWHDFAEMSMGSGMSARIDLTDVDGEPAYRVTAGQGITIQATYRNLDRALGMAALFAHVQWDIVEGTSWRDSDLIVPEG